MVDILLNNNSIVRSSSLREKTSLTLTSDVGKVVFDTTGNDLSDDLVLSIKNPNGYKVPQGEGIHALWDKAEIGRVNLFIHGWVLKDLL